MGNLGYFINCICKECNIDMMYLVKTNERNENNFNIVKKLPLFYKEVFCAFNESKTLVPLHSLSADEFLQQTIWNSGGNFRVFRDIDFFAKIYPTRK